MERKKPTYLQAIIPFLAMLFFIVVGYVILKLRIELMLASAAFVAGIIAMRLGYTWKDMEEAISSRMKQITPAVYIMWAVGVVIGSCMFSGSIPVIIYYGLQVVNPQFLIVFTFLICLVLASVTGTAWGSTGTAGVAMVGISIGLGVPVEMTAGAAISGAIFGDKMSPLSDTTNLCPAATGGVTLYEHIRHMWYTTLPATIICLIAYFILGMNLDLDSSQTDMSAAESMIDNLAAIFNFEGINPLLMMIPLIIIFLGAGLKKPTVPTMFVGSVSAIFVGMYCNGFTLANGTIAAIKGFDIGLTNFDPALLDESIATLITRGGMFGMIGIIVIIYTGYAFTALWSMSGGISKAFSPIIGKIKTRAQTVTSAVVVTVLLDGSCGTSYVPAIVVPELFRKKYIEMGMKLRNLSRTLEDAGTCLNPVWPWSMSGMFYATAFGVATLDYVPWAFLCLMTPIFAILTGLTGFGIAKLTEEEKVAEFARIEKEEKSLRKEF